MDLIYGSKKRKRKSISKSTTKDIYERAKGKCEACKGSLSGIRGRIHHKNRKRDDNKLSNLKLLCPNCHARAHKTDKPKKTKKRVSFGY